MGTTPSQSTAQRWLLACGFVAVPLWIGTDLAARWLTPGYNAVAQTISELSAPGAATRPLVVALNMAHYALMVAFGAGVARNGEGSRSGRAVGALLVAHALTSALALAFMPWHKGEPATTPANTINTVVMAISVFCFVGAMCFAVAAYRNWFRWYSAATLAAYAVATVLGVVMNPANAAGARPPTIGVQERSMVATFLVWVILLAVTLLRTGKRGAAAPH